MENSRYVQMCEQAYELMNYWKPAVGNRVFLKMDLYAQDNQLTSVRQLGQKPTYKKGFYHFSEFTLTELFDAETFFSFCVFIPYQHHIQSRVLKNLGTEYDVLWAFHEFCTNKKTGKPINRYSFDELWLMFYYYSVHGKVWDGEDWVLLEEVNDVRELYSG